VGFCCLLLATDPNGINSYPTQHWRYFIITFFTVLFFFGYFICLPFLAKGRTLGFLILRLRIYNLISTKNFFINLIKREFFIWGINAIGLFILGIVLWSYDNPQKLIQTILFTTDNTFDGGLRFLGTVFQVVFSIGFLSVIIVIIHMFINNKKRCFIDRVSDTCVIKLVDVNSKDPDGLLNTSKPLKRNYGLPGDIVSNASDEIDGL
jgi:hypothetical protein